MGVPTPPRPHRSLIGWQDIPTMPIIRSNTDGFLLIHHIEDKTGEEFHICEQFWKKNELDGTLMIFSLFPSWIAGRQLHSYMIQSQLFDSKPATAVLSSTSQREVEEGNTGAKLSRGEEFVLPKKLTWLFFP